MYCHLLELEGSRTSSTVTTSPQSQPPSRASHEPPTPSSREQECPIKHSSYVQRMSYNYRTHLAEEEAEHAGDVGAAHLVARLAARSHQAVHQLLGHTRQVLVRAGAGQDLQRLRPD